MNQAFENTQLSPSGQIETINSPYLSYDGMSGDTKAKTPAEYNEWYKKNYGKKKKMGGRFKKK